MKKLFFTILMLASVSRLSSQEIPIYKNPDLSPQERAEDLVSRLTLEQKAALMNFESVAIPEFDIPRYSWCSEALHGSAFAGYATVFPQAIGRAASWDNELLLKVFDAVSTEQRVKFIQARKSPEGVTMHRGLTAWTPNINIFRDPRWGRGQETYGEDPYLTTVMGRAVVNGLQGDTGLKYDKLHACLKHFAIHSGPEYKRHWMNVEHVSHRDLYETYLYAFERLVKTTDVKEVMCAYNAWEGNPCCGYDKLLIKILRDEWGFNGLVVTDCWAVGDFSAPDRYNIFPNDMVSSVAHAVVSGADLECGTEFGNVTNAVRSGKLSMGRVDEAVTRLMKARFELGEMDPMEDVSWCSIPETKLCCEEHHELALEMARKSMTLLQNRNDILPLRKNAKYVVTGPNAADSLVMWGNYNGTPLKTTTILEGIINKVGEANVIYTLGCSIAETATDDENYISDGNANDVSIALKGIRKADRTDFSIFKDADAIIFVGGISAVFEGEEHPVPFKGFKGGDRTSIELPSTQRKYIEELSRLGKPIIFVNLSGSAIAMKEETERCDAILQAWYGGEAGGEAVADVLFGDYNPAGRLPVTFYASDSQLPEYEDYAMTSRTYRYFKGEPLFRFGHGLSYTQFRYGKARLKDGVLRIPVKNIGKKDGEEVVQVYIKDTKDTEGPHMSLRGFKRVHIPAGEAVTVEIPMSREEMDVFNPVTGKMEGGNSRYRIYYGGSSAPESLRSLTTHL